MELAIIINCYFSLFLRAIMYKLIRPFMFSLDPETAHNVAIQGLKLRGKLGCIDSAPHLPVNVMGLNFTNPVGLAAGLDKNGEAIDGLASQGFGFIEVGTVTPRPQPGNPKPRIFRLVEAEAIINRMGFNNQGVDHLIANVKAKKYKGIVGINIGKNFDTPVEEAEKDYLICLEKVYPYADYITVNLSSPNTPGLRMLQFGDSLKRLLEQLKTRQQTLQQQHNSYVPLAIKIAPDMTEEETVLVAHSLVEAGMDAVIATNTTIAREAVKHLPHGNEAGGLSGAPLLEASTKTVKLLSEALQGKLPIIAAGGITTGAHAVQKLQAGASLVQVYTGFIYRGNELIYESVNAIKGSGILTKG